METTYVHDLRLGARDRVGRGNPRARPDGAGGDRDRPIGGRPMTVTRPFRSHNLLRDHARPRAAPRPPDAACEADLLTLIRPILPALQHRYRAHGLRVRLLPLPVMVAVVLSAIWRQVPGVRTLASLLRHERLFDQDARRVSPAALSKRLRTVPASLFAELFAAVVPQLHARAQARQRPLPPVLTRLQAHFPRLWAVDATTLEALFKRLDVLRDHPGQVLGGTLLALADLTTHQPVHLRMDPEGAANEKRFLPALRAIVPPGTLLVFDLEFWHFAWFAWLTRTECWFVTRVRADLVFRVHATLASGGGVLDQLVQISLYQPAACPAPMRMVTLHRGGTVYRYLTNVLDPTRLPALDVPDLYARRWRIEDAFLIVKRLLGLSYLWGGAPNTIALQCWGTWLVYAALVDLCDAVADELHLPLERISIEMVYRGLYFHGSALLRGEHHTAPAYLAAHPELGIVKPRRPGRERERLKRLTPDPALLDTVLGTLS